MNLSVYLDKIVVMFKDELKESLVGVYLHGSYAMGCFNPKRSDIDFIVVIREKLTSEQTRQLAKKLLALREQMPNAIELSIVLEANLTPFMYPTPIEFHYSDMHREKYKLDEHYVCGGYLDYDFASQFAIAYDRGIALHGESLSHLYKPIDRQYYISSIIYDIKDAAEDIISNPMYITLNLCRVLYFLREGVMSSKKEGGEWGVQALPSIYHAVIEKYLHEYTTGVDNMEYDSNQLKTFALYMQGEIQNLLSMK